MVAWGAALQPAFAIAMSTASYLIKRSRKPAWPRATSTTPQPAAPSILSILIRESEAISLPSMERGTLEESVTTSNHEVDAAASKGGGNKQVAPSAIAEAMEQLPTSSTKAYFAAKLQVPELVTRETPESRFLAAENGNIALAAQRLASYWESRVELFGEERAFLPMDQTGKGALTPRDIEMVRRLAFTSAPCDKQGRPMVAFDQLRFTSEDRDASHHLARLRVYLMRLPWHRSSRRRSPRVL